MAFNLTDQALNVARVQTRNYRARATGLLPNTIYTISIDGEPWAEGARQSGKDFGANLISDSNGDLAFEFLYEVTFARNQNFELPSTTTLQFQNEQVSSQNRRSAQLVNTVISVDLTDPTEQSKAQILINKTLLLTAGPVNAVFPIE